ncbi:hypothetical protein OPQ81_000363 [Rhizoctonia solani]|nr:hypothetical protein OPQ81_000363 [Rhizoctonia solani]
MPPHTRSSTRTVSVTTRAALARARSSQKVEATKIAKPSHTRKAVPKSKPKPKKEPEPKPEPEPAPALKRARRLNARQGLHSNKASGKLGLMNIPVEVLIEIARYVHPLDLIMLSRVNKFFRELFMDKRSAMIWRSARENVPGLPPCPDDVCEPQYAAMIFTKRCSMCGGYAPREMDPALLVRLCVHCRDQELVDINRVTDATLLMISRGVVPGRTHRWTSWCLYKEARAVKIKLNELTEAGDQEALDKWKEERRKIVRARKRTSEPLSKWLQKREREREQDLNNQKSTREEEIKSRLMKLGWERDDLVCHDHSRYKQWQSMTFVAKPLTDKIWDNILPHLLVHLELNRNQRLERERDQRRVMRSSALYTWVNKARIELRPFARVEPVEGHQLEAGPSEDWNFLTHTNPVTIHRQACPSQHQVREWEDYKALLDNDVPHEQFIVDFEEKKLLFQQLIVAWQCGLEKQLMQVLPDNTHVPNFTVSPFNMSVETSEKKQPISSLPEDIQKLLRADAIFSILASSYDGTTYFYPDDFNHFVNKIHVIHFHAEANEVAKALLRVIGSPDASYLGLSALGRAFRCGRCSPAIATKYTWKGIIEHYLESISSWKHVIQQPQVRSDKKFVYVCTHDINCAYHVGVTVLMVEYTLEQL